jgi:hypothetical protein
MARLRLTLLLVAPERGGVLALEGEDVPLDVGDAVVFRPDLVAHGISDVVEGSRLTWCIDCELPLGRMTRSGRRYGRRRKSCRCR